MLNFNEIMEIKSKFEFFRRNNLIYLDSGATTQVPDIVVRDIEQSLNYRGNPSRSAHILAQKNEKLLVEARENVAKFIGASANEIVFTKNATDSINLAVDSIADHIKSGDEIIIGISEHHSNMLPYLRLVKKGAKIKTVGVKNGLILVEDIKALLNDKTKIVAIAQCSNVLGNINDVQSIGKIIKEKNKNIFFVIDGTQAVAHIPVDVKSMKADFYAFSGHKMYGPDGVGVLYISEHIHHFLSPVRVGGGTVKNVAITFQTDSDIISPEYFQSLITLEGGTPNTSNIIGLSRAINFIRSIGFDEIRNHEHKLIAKLISEISKFEEVVIFGPTDFKDKIGLLSFGLKEFSTKELGEHLGRQKICIRYGAHCAFLLVEQFGQESLRISLGVYNTEEDIDQVLSEIRFFLDKKKGLIKNPNLELLKNKIYYKNTLIVRTREEEDFKAGIIIERIKSAIYAPHETEVIVMGGHFLAIPDMDQNKFYPSIKGLLPERLNGLLEEFGMTSFPLFSWQIACEMVANLQADGISAKLLIVANDTTGINELRLSNINKDNRTAESYRDELLAEFSGDNDIPDSYLKILKENKLGKKDIIKSGPDYFMREVILRANFKKFISGNKKYFDGVINYSAEENENIDVSINILDNQQIKTCNFETFNSKTGGRFCIVEVAELIAELFGKARDVSFNYLNTKVLKPKVEAKHKMFVMLSPAMCDNAITRGAELYTKLFLQEKGQGSFKFFNIPLGADAERSLAIGAEMKYISDKDSIEVLDMDTSPIFADLWRMTEYNLLYNPSAYISEIEGLFEKIGINKKSSILDTCVGPGFFTTEMLQKGYNFRTADKNPYMIIPFQKELKSLGINHDTTISSWLDLPKHFEKESFDMLFNRGNSVVYANGGWNESKPVKRKESMDVLLKTFKIYYDLLKPGGYLYVDKHRDSEVPDSKVSARLNIKDTKEEKDVIFTVERRPAEKVRFAQLSLRDKDNKEESLLTGLVYDLSELEMSDLLKQAGFSKIERLNLKEERHFVVWLAKK